EGYKMAGQYVTLGGMVFDSPNQEKWTGLLNSEDNQTALIYVHRPPQEALPQNKKEELGWDSEPEASAELISSEESDPLGNPTRISRVVMTFPIETLDQFVEKYASQIIPGGMFVRTSSTLPLMTIFDFEFKLKDGNKILKGSAQVEQVRRL